MIIKRSRSSLAHAQPGRCGCCRAASPIWRPRRTNHRHQYLIFAASNCLLAGYEAQPCAARWTGRSSLTLRSRIAFWPRRPHRPGRSSRSSFARSSPLTLRALWTRTGGKHETQQRNTYRSNPHQFLPLLSDHHRPDLAVRSIERPRHRYRLRRHRPERPSHHIVFHNLRCEDFGLQPHCHEPQ